MKNLLTTAFLLVIVAAATSFVAYRLGGDPRLEAAIAQGDAMEWMRVEFNLTAEQYARIKTLHDSYAVECERHCAAIVEAERAKEAAESSGRPEDLKALQQRVEELRLICETAIAAHVRRCAAEMSPEAGERYLAMVLPKIADFDHKAPPDVRLNGHVH